MGARLVIDYIVEQKAINLNTLTDKDFSNFSWLNEREPIYNMKGEKVSKSYYYENTKEAIRIVYAKVFGDYVYDGVTYPNVFLGFSNIKCWMDWAGEIGETKNMQQYRFTLEPIFVGDGTETIVGFSSQKMRKCMKEERYSADDYLQSKNPDLYYMLYNKYKSLYDKYMNSGNKTPLVEAITNETDADTLAVFNNEVYGYEPMTTRELILMNLQ